MNKNYKEFILPFPNENEEKILILKELIHKINELRLVLLEGKLTLIEIETNYHLELTREDAMKIANRNNIPLENILNSKFLCFFVTSIDADVTYIHRKG